MSTLDLSGYESSVGLPKGEFVMRLTSAKMKETRSGKEALNLEFSIVGPTHEKFKVYDTLNIFNDSDIAQKIAREKLVNLLECMNLEKSIDTNNLSPLLNKLVKAKIQEENGYARIKFFKKHEEESKGEDF